jgi:hypothetical protein
MLADRYDGHHGLGNVRLWSVWNEPNLQLFLTPQFSTVKVTAVKTVKGKKVRFRKTTFKIVGPANYAKLYRAAYSGIKAGNRLAQVAIGETSNLGRDRPIAIRGQGQSVAPGTFARLLAQQKGLRFNAWATHPYTTFPSAKPLQKVRYPNVTLALLPTFEKNLRKFFHRRVPVWITEYGHQTKPENAHGVSYARQAAYAKQALSVARADRNVQMFVWFTFRDSAGNAWKSGLERANGSHKPSYAAFSALARLIDPAA